MKGGSTTLDGSLGSEHELPRRAPEVLALTVVWTANEPYRLGETLLLPGDRPVVFGRGAPDGDEENRVVLVRQRPGGNEQAPRVENPFLSRVQLRIEREGDGLQVAAVGKRPLRIDDHETTAATVRPGELFEIKGLYGFLCGWRPALMRSWAVDAPPAFGEADVHGVVGESAAAWSLREQIAFGARRSAHVLVTGASGTGKELVAQAIHGGSARAGRKLVARNAATLPSGLIDAELFGNVANYPHAGMPERPGLIGQADGSTLFLDEIGELPADLQAHLLRVMDGGDYQRLGEARRRSADIRFIAATNRPPSELKHDLLGRFGLRIQVPGLAERREDVCLLGRHLLGRIAAGDPQLGQRFFSQWNGRRGEPRMSAALARALTLHDYTAHARELEALLWQALSTSPGTFLDLTEEVEALRGAAASGAPSPPAPPREVTADEIRQALARHAGVKDRVWRDLGLPSRHALRRLILKHGIEVGEPDES